MRARTEKRSKSRIAYFITVKKEWEGGGGAVGGPKRSAHCNERSNGPCPFAVENVEFPQLFGPSPWIRGTDWHNRDIPKGNAQRFGSHHGCSRRIDGRQLVDGLEDRDARHIWRIVADHFPESPLFNQTHGMGSVLSREDAVECGGPPLVEDVQAPRIALHS